MNIKGLSVTELLQKISRLTPKQIVLLMYEMWNEEAERADQAEKQRDQLIKVARDAIRNASAGCGNALNELKELVK